VVHRAACLTLEEVTSFAELVEVEVYHTVERTMAVMIIMVVGAASAGVMRGYWAAGQSYLKFDLAGGRLSVLSLSHMDYLKSLGVMDRGVQVVALVEAGSKDWEQMVQGACRPAVLVQMLAD